MLKILFDLFKRKLVNDVINEEKKVEVSVSFLLNLLKDCKELEYKYKKSLDKLKTLRKVYLELEESRLENIRLKEEINNMNPTSVSKPIRSKFSTYC